MRPLAALAASILLSGCATDEGGRMRMGIQDPIDPRNMLCAVLILSIMVLPMIVSVSLDALRAVPSTYREAALGLGAVGASRDAPGRLRSPIRSARVAGCGAGLHDGRRAAIGNEVHQAAGRKQRIHGDPPELTRPLVGGYHRSREV